MSEIFINPKDEEFYLSGNKFIKENGSTLKVVSTAFKDFFKKKKGCVYNFSVFVIILITCISFCFYNYFIGEDGIIWVFVFLFAILFLSIPLCADVNEQLKILIYISSEGLEIQESGNRYNKINISSSNIEDIYIKNSQMIDENTSKKQRYLPTYNIILRLKKPMFLKTFNHYKQEFVLIDKIKKKNNLESTEYMVNLIKKYLNLVSYKKEENIVKYIRIEDKIVLEKTRDYLNITTDAKEDFFDIKILPFIRVCEYWIITIDFMIFMISGILLAICCGISTSGFNKDINEIGGIIAIICFASLIGIVMLFCLCHAIYFIVYKFIDKKMILSISNAGIDVITKEKTISIDKYDIKNLYKTGIKKGDFLANFKVEPYSYIPLDRYSNYTAIMLKLREPISLEPINKKRKQEFSLLGNIPREHYDKMELIYEEIKNMLGFSEKDSNSYVEKEEENYE